MKACVMALILYAMSIGIAATQSSGADAAAGEAIVPRKMIRFDDLAPAGMALQQCWDAIGIDARERVYIGFTGRRADGREDFAVFRYDPATGSRRLLGTFMDVSAA